MRAQTLAERPRGVSLPLPMDGHRPLRFDMDALVSVHFKPTSQRGTTTSSSSVQPFPRRGSTSNCASRYSRRRRRSSAAKASEAAALDDSSAHGAADEPCFFVEDESPPAVLTELSRETTTNASDRGSTRRVYGTPNRPHRSSSMPVPRQVSRHTGAAPSSTRPARRLTDQPRAGETAMRRRKTVRFVNPYEPEVIREARSYAQTYDDLLFNVAGLYHTLSYLHDPEFLDDAATDSSSSAASDHSEPPPPMERSESLMIAEFLYRSAVFLGYPPDKDVWIPGFREQKKFSSNDVKRWRRLAHFDWEQEEREFVADEAERHTRGRATTRASSRASSRVTSTRGLRATVSQWLHISRSSSRELAPAAAAVPIQAASTEKPLPKLLVNPPLVSPTTDLSKLVEIANSCISYGGFRFTERQIRKLCNIPIRS